jgi:endothelin-converting enzyme/putative endopeptidase
MRAVQVLRRSGWVFFGLTFLALLAASGQSLAQAASAKSISDSKPVLDVSAMDRTVDPCVDFFAYSCGGWIKNNPIPPDKAAWGVYSKVAEENLAQLRGLLEAAAGGSNHNAYTQKIGDYYASCMDESAIEALGAKPLHESLQRIDTLQSKHEIASADAGMSRHGILFTFGSSPDFRDADHEVADLAQGGLGLPDRDFYFKDDEPSKKLRQAYVAHVTKMFVLLGDSQAQASAEAAAVVQIETALARGSLTRVEQRDPKKLDHTMTIAELEKLAPSFDWHAYFTRLGLPSLASLNVQEPDFFKNLSTQLYHESLAAWKSYLRWHIVHTNARNLSSPFVNENFDFYGKTLSGQEQLAPRWKRCASEVDDALGEALGQAYVEKYFSPDAKQQALKMVREIEAAMGEDIESLTWMTPETKRNALEKLHAVANKIGYPDHWRDYTSLAIVRGDAFGNANRAREFEFQRELGKIGKPVDRSEWGMTPPTVNAEYDPQHNDINFPAGILQPPLFSATSDAAPNYGNTGGTIGHELTHGFDDEGRQFDAHGNLRDWWTAADAQQFEERAACISDQYSQYVIIDDIKINGKLTLGEDVADLGGLLLAYMAWKQDTKSQKLDPIDALTPDQRFFVGYAQSWCGSTRDADKRLRATTDPHSPDKYRTNGVVSNVPEFQQAFQCKTGAPMAPAKRCRVW